MHNWNRKDSTEFSLFSQVLRDNAGSFLMSKARLLQDYLIPGNAENENTLITDYWLEFVAATDGQDPAPLMKFSEADIREKLRDFQQQMSAVIRNHESLRQALSTDHFEPMASAHSGAGIKGVPVPWASGTAPAKKLPPELLEEESEDDDGDYGSTDEKGSQVPTAIGSFLLKLLGK
jgi:hypothetical protein